MQRGVVARDGTQLNDAEGQRTQLGTTHAREEGAAESERQFSHQSIASLITILLLMSKLAVDSRHFHKIPTLSHHLISPLSLQSSTPAEEAFHPSCSVLVTLWKVVCERHCRRHAGLGLQLTHDSAGSRDATKLQGVLWRTLATPSLFQQRGLGDSLPGDQALGAPLLAYSMSASSATENSIHALIYNGKPRGGAACATHPPEGVRGAAPCNHCQPVAGYLEGRECDASEDPPSAQ